MKHKIKKGVKNFINMSFMDSVALNKKCGPSLIVFELLYKLAAIAVFYPLFIKGFEFTLKKAGFRYLTNSYIFTYIKSPYTLIFILLVLITGAFYLTYEVACLSVCYDAAYHGNPILVTSIFKAGVKLMGRTMKKKKINSFFHVVSVSLMMNITLFVFLLLNITLPDSATDWLKEQKVLLIVLGVILATFFVYCMMHIFIMNFMAYDGTDITESKRKSRQLIRARGIKTFMVILGWNAVILLAIYLVYWVMVLIIWAGVFILDKVNMGMAIYLSISRVVLTVAKILLCIVSVPLSYGVITGLFFRYRCDSGKEYNMGDITEEIGKNKSGHSGVQYVISGIVIAAVLSVNIYYLVSAFESNPFSKVEIFSDTGVMAHRGCSYNAPENTMLAFENAVNAMADYIELDVHETADGEIVVIHDPSLKRTTGVNEKVWNVNYEEIRTLDAGSYFGEDEAFAECYIPTLREVMEFTKDKIKLNIEIKLSDNEPHLVEKVVALIQEFEYTEDCYVTSMSYEALKEIKNIDPNIKTGYVLTLAYGNFYNLDYCDAFSINAAYVNKNMVDAIHNRGKEIFVWTVNSRSKAREMTAIGVDAVITDNPVMAKEVVYSKYSSPLFSNVISYVFK
ncbi:MAG: glycerophosphodiester phosphodiesterase family protein [Butyrivibrio sp.]